MLAEVVTVGSKNDNVTTGPAVALTAIAGTITTSIAMHASKAIILFINFVPLSFKNSYFVKTHYYCSPNQASSFL